MIEQSSSAHCVALSCVFLCVDEVMFMSSMQWNILCGDVILRSTIGWSMGNQQDRCFGISLAY